MDALAHASMHVPMVHAGERGRWKLIVARYQRLPPLNDLGDACDEYTDAMVYEGDELAKPLSPGRGEGS